MVDQQLIPIKEVNLPETIRKYRRPHHLVPGLILSDWDDTNPLTLKHYTLELRAQAEVFHQPVEVREAIPDPVNIKGDLTSLPKVALENQKRKRLEKSPSCG